MTLDWSLAKRAARFAVTAINNYAAGRNAHSRAYSSHGAESDPRLWMKSRLAECAFCIWADIDIEKLNWSAAPDHGTDVIIPHSGVMIDVKHTGWHSKYLIWPVRKNAIFISKRFDVLCLVKGDENEYEICGWITKAAFYSTKLIADADHKLTEGTWHIEEDRLAEPEKLLRPKYHDDDGFGIAWG